MFRRKNPTDDDTPETDEAAASPKVKATPDAPVVRRVPGTVPDVGRRAIDIGTPAAIRAAAAQARRPKETKKLVVGREISLSGAITACDTLVVEGRVEATLENSELLEITPGGAFKGRVSINEAIIAGEFDGELVGRGRLLVASGGRIVGTIKYGSLVVEEGGHVSGQVDQIVDNATDDTPA